MVFGGSIHALLPWFVIVPMVFSMLLDSTKLRGNSNYYEDFIGQRNPGSGELNRAIENDS
jgi:hypothetical protein